MLVLEYFCVLRISLLRNEVVFVMIYLVVADAFSLIKLIKIIIRSVEEYESKYVRSPSFLLLTNRQSKNTPGKRLV